MHFALLYGAPICCGALLRGIYADMVEKMHHQVNTNRIVSSTALYYCNTIGIASGRNLLAIVGEASLNLKRLAEIIGEDYGDGPVNQAPYPGSEKLG